MADRTICEALGRARRRRGLTQEQLAEASGVSLGVIRKLECGDRLSARLATLHKLAAALGVPTTALLDTTPAATAGTPDVEPDGLLRLRQILNPVPGAAPDSTDETGEAPDATALRESVAQAVCLADATDFNTSARTLPTLLADAQSTLRHMETDEERASALRSLSTAYRLTGRFLIQLHYRDLAHAALTQAVRLAQDSCDIVLEGSVGITTTWLLIRERRLDEAEHLAVALSDAIEPRFRTATPWQLGTYGWLLLQAASAATRNNRPDVATELFRTARAAAVRIGPGSGRLAYEHRDFGTPLVSMKLAEQASVQGDARRVLKIAKSVPARSAATVEDYSRHRLDVANAYLEMKETGEALETLIEVRNGAPDWFRVQPFAKDVTSRLVEKRKRRMPTELVSIADDLGIAV
ncbi:hypothetical protein B4N89_15325 [Embleya scabrispora]|uniref:HTH cro/C1-type domain-containing protein n=1 Tax=Embleya scabrispora TaxID=159449 RepID=A0A1T3NZ54_9ACTN|nr:helix-turn-helix transcriptional regulator [Embleya scabrispora]OPC82129.1 hypothetical protein B4N89_15325 [Embleya scabrispora]